MITCKTLIITKEELATRNAYLPLKKLDWTHFPPEVLKAIEKHDLVIVMNRKRSKCKIVKNRYM